MDAGSFRIGFRPLWMNFNLSLIFNLKMKPILKLKQHKYSNQRIKINASNRRNIRDARLLVWRSSLTLIPKGNCFITIIIIANVIDKHRKIERVNASECIHDFFFFLAHNNHTDGVMILLLLISSDFTVGQFLLFNIHFNFVALLLAIIETYESSICGVSTSAIFITLEIVIFQHLTENSALNVRKRNNSFTRNTFNASH